MTLKLPLSQDVEMAMAKLKAYEEERETGRWLDSQGGSRVQPSALVFLLLFCFAFLISVVSVQWLKCIQSLSSGQALGSWFMLTKLIRDGLIKKKKKKEVDWLIYTDSQADGTSYVTGSTYPISTRKVHLGSQVENRVAWWMECQKKENWWCQATLSQCTTLNSRNLSRCLEHSCQLNRTLTVLEEDLLQYLIFIKYSVYTSHQYYGAIYCLAV